MAVGLTAIRDALAAQIDSETSGIRCYPRMAGQVQFPAAVVFPGDPYVDRDQSMQRGHVLVNMDVAVIVPLSDLNRAQDTLDDLIDTVTDAILTDRTVSGTVLDLHVPEVQAPIDAELSGVTVMYATLQVEAIVGDS